MTRFPSARWATISEGDAGRWSLTISDEADDELIRAGIGVSGDREMDVVPHVEFVLAQLGLAPVHARGWHEDELGDLRAQILPR